MEALVSKWAHVSVNPDRAYRLPAELQGDVMNVPQVAAYLHLPYFHGK
jgi:hypothetical protein